MSREIEELRALARQERTQVRQIGAAWKESASDEVDSYARRHRKAALGIAVGAGYLGVRLLGSRGGRAAAKKRGVGRAALGAVAALLAKSLPALALQATAALKRESEKGSIPNRSHASASAPSNGAQGPQRTDPRLPRPTPNTSV